MLTEVAPAKLNLTLEVLGKREDGYHELRSVVQTIGLCDRLRFLESDRTEYCADLPEWDAGQSLVARAVDLLRGTTGCGQGVRIEVEKRIPLTSGLGGDSSNAAAVLRGLNRFWGLGLPQERLHEVASRLGSDVALFLHGGTLLMEGRGERVTPLPPLADTWFVLVLPRVPREAGKTRRAYASLRPVDYTGGQATSRLVEVLRTGSRLVPSLLLNVFERRAFSDSPELAACRQAMMDAGAGDVHLAGSGPALFALFSEKSRAAEVQHRLDRQEMQTYLVGTAAAGA